MLQELCGFLTTQAQNLGRYGAPIQYIAQEVKKMTV